MDIPNNYLEKKVAIPKKRGINSYVHEVTLKVVEYVGEQKKFGLWLGVVKRYGAGKMLSILKELEKKNIKSPAYLLACTKKCKSFNK